MLYFSFKKRSSRVVLHCCLDCFSSRENKSGCEKEERKKRKVKKQSITFRATLLSRKLDTYTSIPT